MNTQVHLVEENIGDNSFLEYAPLKTLIPSRSLLPLFMGGLLCTHHAYTTPFIGRIGGLNWRANSPSACFEKH